MKFVPLLLCLGAAWAAEVHVVEQIVAKVNSEIITSGELERQRQQLIEELRARGVQGPDLEKLVEERSKHLLRDKIDQHLLVQKAKEMNVNVDAEVTKYIAEIQLQNKIADPDKFQAWVREQTGMPFEDFRAETRNAMMTQRVIGMEVGSRINIPRAEVEKYYNEHKDEFMRQERVFLREILVSTEGKDAAGTEAAEKKAKDLVARARRGERFGELARDNSDADSAKNGGELPGYARGDLRPELEKLVFDQERNHVTDPIRVTNGFLIIKVEEQHKAGLASIEEVEREIQDRLSRPLYEPKVREFLTRLRTEAFLEIKDGYVDTGAAPGKDTRWTDPAELKPETVSKEEIVNQTRRRRLFWAIPLPGTQTKAKSSSR
ncbi:MAG: peptidylprolyl isomerase [Bryobacteraceae bacterium]